ncbi:IAN4 [Symbiodinium sp. CCMP2456]|nr:IAN4 [Symbiodinium sp. CCMP2456]
MGAHCCRQDAPLLPGEPTDLDSPRFGDGPSLIPPFGVEDGNDVHDSESEDDIPQLPVGGRFTVMMFGMTGAGKSAIGNLMAGCEAFASGDDTASVTNLDSVMRFESADDSFVILDTIGLGDTEIDQDKVVASIRDVALSAVNGVDAMCFVMRNARITDDAIARLIYVTEFLWGTDCLLNLYVIVTFASRYLASREDANQWIERQVELNWRFKHIYDLVGQNPYRFIFIDNPSLDSGEPNVEERQAASKRALMTAFAKHPRDVIPPFTHSVMQKAKQLVAEQQAEVEKAAAKVQEVVQSKPKKKRKSSKSRPVRSSRSQSHESSGVDPVKEALEEKKRAQDNLDQALIKVKKNAEFQREVAKEAELATLRFGQAYQNQVEEAGAAPTGSPTASTSTNPGGSGNPVQACKRMFFSLVNKMGGKNKVPNPKALAAQPKDTQQPVQRTQKRRITADEIQSALDNAIYQLKMGVRGQAPMALFKQLDAKQNGMVTPMEFAKFVHRTVHGMSKAQVGGLWRLADRNCDGKLDFQEFCDLLAFRPPGWFRTCTVQRQLWTLEHCEGMALLAMFLAAALFTVAVHVCCPEPVPSAPSSANIYGCDLPLKAMPHFRGEWQRSHGSVAATERCRPRTSGTQPAADSSAAKVQWLPPYTARQILRNRMRRVKDACCSLPKGRYVWSWAMSSPPRLASPRVGSKAKAVVRLQSSYQQAACSPEKPIVIEADAEKDYIETVVVPEHPEILAESETAAQVITAPATKATFGRTAVKARMVQGARFRSARFAGQGPSISQTKQRRRMGARLRAVSAVYEMPPMPFDASRVRFQIQTGLNTNPRPRAPKAGSQPVHESAERMVSAGELLRASYMCEERETLDTSSLACEARLLASAHRGAGAVAASR